MTALPYLAVARFHGPEASSFLQSQLSADIGALEPGGATFACYCSVRGQVFGLLLVCRRDEDFLVAAASELLAGMLTRLQTYVFRAKVVFSEDPDLIVCGLEPESAADAPGVVRPADGGPAYCFTSGKGIAEVSHERFRAFEIAHGITWLSQET